MDALMAINPTILALAATGIALIALIALIILSLRQRKLLNHYRHLLNGETGKDLESLLLSHANQLEEIQTSLQQLTHETVSIKQNARSHIQKAATVRFNAFPDTGSDLSFAITLLDQDNNGFVLSSLYGRNESRVYAKPIKAGTSTYALSEEEKKAIEKALATVSK